MEITNIFFDKETTDNVFESLSSIYKFFDNLYDYYYFYKNKNNINNNEFNFDNLLFIILYNNYNNNFKEYYNYYLIIKKKLINKFLNIKEWTFKILKDYFIIIMEYKCMIYILMNVFNKFILNSNADKLIKYQSIEALYSFIISCSKIKDKLDYVSTQKKIKDIEIMNIEIKYIISLLYDYLNRFVFNNEDIEIYDYKFVKNKDNTTKLDEIKTKINNDDYYNFNLEKFNNYIINRQYINIDKLNKQLFTIDTTVSNIEYINIINKYIKIHYKGYNEIRTFYNNNLYHNIIEIYTDLQN